LSAAVSCRRTLPVFAAPTGRVESGIKAVGDLRNRAKAEIMPRHFCRPYAQKVRDCLSCKAILNEGACCLKRFLPARRKETSFPAPARKTRLYLIRKGIISQAQFQPGALFIRTVRHHGKGRGKAPFA